jgi:acyl-CoA dehydrogenase
MPLLALERLAALAAPWLDDSHHAFREACRRFTQSHISPHAYDWEEAEGFPRSLFSECANAGLLGPTLPADLGGAGGDTLHGVVWTEELVRGGSVGVVAGLGSLQIALPVVLELGTDEQRARFVPPVTRGERVAALAITEPGAGSDVAGTRTRAVRDGDDYVITGAKTFITSGVQADQVTVLARTSDDRHGGLTFFVVERGMPGFSVSRALKKTGWRASDTAELSFEGVRVPAANRIGDEGSGFLALMRCFDGERIGLAAQGVAIAEVCLADATRWARERHTFGRPLHGHQVVRHKLADMLTKTMATKAFLYAVADQHRRGVSTPADVAALKNAASELARDVSWEAVQILGGSGYMRESRVERLSRDARLLPIGGGTDEILSELVARSVGL